MNLITGECVKAILKYSTEKCSNFRVKDLIWCIKILEILFIQVHNTLDIFSQALRDGGGAGWWGKSYKSYFKTSLGAYT